MDLNYRILWFEDTDEPFETLSRRTRKYVETKHLECAIERIKNAKDFDLTATQLNDFDLLIVDQNLEEKTYGASIIKEIRTGNYVNDVLFYSGTGEKSLIDTIKGNDLEGVFYSDRDHRKFFPKLQHLIDKTVRRSENVVNIRGIVMDVTSEFDSSMSDLVNLSLGLLSQEEVGRIRTYIVNTLLKNMHQSSEELIKKYDLEKTWKISDILNEQDFMSDSKARLMNKLLNVNNEKIKKLADVCKTNYPEMVNNGRVKFHDSYNNEVLRFRNALAHVKSVKDSNGPVFIKKMDGVDYYCNEEFCLNIRKSLIVFKDLFNAIQKAVEQI